MQLVLIACIKGGWVCETSKIHEDMDEEVDQAFANVDHCLKDAGGKGWCQVYRVNLYVTVINDQMMGALVRNLKKWMPDHQPIMTAVGVAQLGLPGMRVEVEVVAHDPEGAAEIEAKKAAEKKE